MAVPTGPHLPGLQARRRLGLGPEAPWLARADDGTWVVVRRGTRPPGLPDHPALLRVIGSLSDDQGCPWVVTSYVPGSGLDRRVERLGPLAAGAAASVAVAVADALSALHVDGLVHGDLSAARVLLGPDDRVVLDASCARASGEPARSRSGAEDCAALAALVEQVWRPPLPAPVTAALHVARSEGATPTAVADAVRRARGSRQPRSWRLARRAVAAGLAAGGLAGVLAAAALLGIGLADKAPAAARLAPQAAIEPPTPPSSTSRPWPTRLVPPAGEDHDRSEDPAPEIGSAQSPGHSPEDTDWEDVLADLDRARVALFAAPDPARVAQVDAEGSAAYRRDLATVNALRALDVRAVGWHPRLLSVSVLTEDAREARLEVVDTVARHVLVDATGRTVERRPARGATGWHVTVQRTEDGWRIATVERALVRAPNTPAPR